MSSERAWGRVFRPNELPSGLTVGGAIDEFLEAAEDGSARDRYGRRFTPEAVDDLRWSLLGRVAEALGAKRMADVRGRDVAALVDELSASGVPRRRLRAVVTSLRALYDYAIERGSVRRNPAERVAMPEMEEGDQPAGRSARRRAAGLAYRATSVAMQVATLLLALIAVVLLVQSA
jgi:hypothetical protein